MAISKRLRFEVLRRDGHRCRYCGVSADEVKLVVDAVVPEALGGSHKDPANLRAACEPCNSGKTSSSPDAPLVAQVAEDALRWAQAMQAAAADVLARRDHLSEAQKRFASLWDRWTYGDEQLPIPKDPGWRQSVDALLASGLPMALLEECIEIAMSRRKVTPENTFRYMCGVAWNKVSEIQERARKIASGDSAPIVNTDPYQRGRVDFARELLSEVTEGEREEFLEAVDDTGFCEANGEPVPTEDDIVLQAASYAQGIYRDQMLYLQEVVLRELRAYPDGLGERAMRHARTVLYENFGADFDERQFLAQALRSLDDELRYPAAEQYLAGLPDEESTEWFAVALSLTESRYRSERGVSVLAAKCAQGGLASQRSAQNLCCGTGRHISVCSQWGTYHARIAGLSCCEDPDHKGHLVCERHLEMLMDGTFVAPDGRTFSACDFTELELEPVPF